MTPSKETYSTATIFPMMFVLPVTNGPVALLRGPDWLTLYRDYERPIDNSTPGARTLGPRLRVLGSGSSAQIGFMAPPCPPLVRTCGPPLRVKPRGQGPPTRSSRPCRPR